MVADEREKCKTNGVDTAAVAVAAKARISKSVNTAHTKLFDFFFTLLRFGVCCKRANVELKLTHT